jgi:hypothetical protein
MKQIDSLLISVMSCDAEFDGRPLSKIIDDIRVGDLYRRLVLCAQNSDGVRNSLIETLAKWSDHAYDIYLDDGDALLDVPITILFVALSDVITGPEAKRLSREVMTNPSLHLARLIANSNLINLEVDHD